MMQQALSVAVIGGSLAGCAIAQVFARAGHQVDVYERSPTELEGRGAGIVLPIPLQQALIADGFIPPDYASLPLGQRDWIIADGSVSGREAWTQSSAASSHQQVHTPRLAVGQAKGDTLRRIVIVNQGGAVVIVCIGYTLA